MVFTMSLNEIEMLLVKLSLYFAKLSLEPKTRVVKFGEKRIFDINNGMSWMRL